jgi:hypothetical protein
MCQKKRRKDWHGDSTEIALVDYALTKTGINKELEKISKNS